MHAEGNVVLTRAVISFTYWLVGTDGLLLIGDRQRANYLLGVRWISGCFPEGSWELFWKLPGDSLVLLISQFSFLG